MKIDDITILPCPSCGNEAGEIKIDKFGESFIKCNYCTVQARYCVVGCSDAPITNILVGLISDWNGGRS